MAVEGQQRDEKRRKREHRQKKIKKTKKPNDLHACPSKNVIK